MFCFVEKSKPKRTNTPIAKRRGLQGSMQMPDALAAMLVRADVEQTAGALAKHLKTKKWQKSVPRAKLPECDLFKPRFYPFLYRGHDWTTVVHRFAFFDDVAKQLSAVLRTRAIWASYEDTSFCFDYALYDSGKLIEVFHLSDPKEFSSLTKTEFAAVEKGGICAFAPHCFFADSKIRKLDTADFKAPSKNVQTLFGQRLDNLFDEFLRNRDAFLGFNIMDIPGREYFPLAEASDDEVVRIDVIGN
jgi:hypothetical protein